MPAIAAISQNACDWPGCPNDWNSPSVLMNPMLLLDQQALERRSLARNEVLFRQDDKVAAIYFVEAGRLRLERRTFDGRLPKAAVLNVLSTDPTSAMSFLTLMAHQVMELRQRLELMKVRSAKERVMLYLDLNAESDRRTVNLRCQLQDIAGELGLTREALYRTLASLERASVIERTGDRILLKKSLDV